MATLIFLGLLVVGLFVAGYLVLLRRRRRDVHQKRGITGGGSDKRAALAITEQRVPCTLARRPGHCINLIARVCNLAIVLQTENRLEHPSGIRNAHGLGKWRAGKGDRHRLMR